MTSECKCCGLIRRRILKAIFWYLNDLYRTFLCKVIIEKTENKYAQTDPENNKMAAMMEFSAAILEL